MLLNKTVVLVGMMGSGKTAVGKALSTALDVTFFDSDYEISLSANRSISEIFERDGSSVFRVAETRVIKRLLQEPPCILSTGGGAFMSTKNRTLIAKLGISVFLSVDLEVLWERVRHKNSRPLLKTANPKGTLSEIFDNRKDLYELADIRIRAGNASSIAQTTQQLTNALAEWPGAINAVGTS